MASITITTVNGTQTTRIADAICALHGYTGFLPGTQTAETKLDFVKRYLIRHIKDQVKIYEAVIAAESARTTTETEIETGINIT
jgi:hypothetical protein